MMQCAIVYSPPALSRNMYCDASVVTYLPVICDWPWASSLNVCLGRCLKALRETLARIRACAYTLTRDLYLCLTNATSLIDSYIHTTWTQTNEENTHETRGYMYKHSEGRQQWKARQIKLSCKCDRASTPEDTAS